MGSGSGFFGNGWAFANSWGFTSSGREELFCFSTSTVGACGGAADPSVVGVAGGVAEVGSADIATALMLNAAMQGMERVFMKFIMLESVYEEFLKEPEARRIRCLANNTILERSWGGALAL